MKIHLVFSFISGTGRSGTDDVEKLIITHHGHRRVTLYPFSNQDVPTMPTLPRNDDGYL